MTRRGDASPVLIFVGQRWKETPTFHLPVRWEHGGHDETRHEFADGSVRVEHRTFTACGRVSSKWGWVDLALEATRDYYDRDLTLMIRRDHAESFARLCDRCKAAT